MCNKPGGDSACLGGAWRPPFGHRLLLLRRRHPRRAPQDAARRTLGSICPPFLPPPGKLTSYLLSQASACSLDVHCVGVHAVSIRNYRLTESPAFLWHLLLGKAWDTPCQVPLASPPFPHGCFISFTLGVADLWEPLHACNSIRILTSFPSISGAMGARKGATVICVFTVISQPLRHRKACLL